MKVLTREIHHADIILGDIVLRYRKNTHNRQVELCPIPLTHLSQVKARRGKALLHPAMEGMDAGYLQGEQMGDSLVQVHRRGDPIGFPAYANAWSAGHTLRNSATAEALEFQFQEIESFGAGGTRITTILATTDGLRCRHVVEWEPGLPGFRVVTEAENTGSDPLVLEMLSCFSISGLSPFASDDMEGRLKLHRFRSAWSLEGRHEANTLEDLHLERYWSQGGCNSLRFGQVGSLPVRQFFPWIGLEDTTAGVFWAAQVAWHGSWQLEISRRDDPICLSGGLADYDFGQWAKTLRPGERFRSPVALLSCCEGSIDEICHRLIGVQRSIAFPEPDIEKQLPIIFNEWCSSWGHPTHENVIQTCDNLADSPTGIFVIDDGWSVRPQGTFQTNGDWILKQESFPEGLLATTREVRKRGMIPGIWFEFEVVTEKIPAFEETVDHQLKRHGHRLQVGKRAFWDLRDPWTKEYLREKVIRLLKENEFGYLKVDYNDSIGLGCDPLDEPTGSLGEGLRQHLQAVAKFFEEIRREVPDILIENCASGGHRIEPGMIARTSMCSFSDAHECLEIPIIAANLLRLIPAEKSQIWCVIRKASDRRRIQYGLAATFLGRMAVSGDYQNPDPDQKALVTKAQEFYRDCMPAFTGGRNVVDQSRMGKSYRYPRGIQVCRRVSLDESRIIIIAHGFEGSAGTTISHTLPEGDWKVLRRLEAAADSVKGNRFTTAFDADFSGNVWLLKRSASRS